MATPAQIASNAAGLFAAGALIRPGDEPIYAELEKSLHAELCPATLMEENLVEEILGAMWRLRNCRFAESPLTALDDDAADRRQTSVDRARTHASRLLYQATAELRRLQTERILRDEVLPEGTDLAGFGICDVGKVVRASHSDPRPGFYKTNPKSDSTATPSR